MIGIRPLEAGDGGRRRLQLRRRPVQLALPVTYGRGGRSAVTLVLPQHDNSRTNRARARIADRVGAEEEPVQRRSFTFMLVAVRRASHALTGQSPDCNVKV